MEEAFTIPKDLLIGLIGGVIVIGIVIAIFGGIDGLTKAWCELNPTFCGQNITYFAGDDITAKNSVLALRCAVNSVANSKIDDETCPESTRTDYGVDLKLEGGYPPMDKAIRRCYGEKCAVCRLPEARIGGEPTISQLNVGGIYNSSGGSDWTKIGNWSDLGDVKFVVNHSVGGGLFVAGERGVFKLEPNSTWKLVFSPVENGLETGARLSGFVVHGDNVSLDAAFLAYKVDNSLGLYRSVSGLLWNRLETKSSGSEIKNINNIFSVGGDLFLLSEGKTDYHTIKSNIESSYEVGKINSGLYRSKDSGLTWEFLEPRVSLDKGVVDAEIKQQDTGGGVGGYVDMKGVKVGEGIGDVTRIIKVGQSLFASSRTAIEYVTFSGDKPPVTDYRFRVKSGGVHKSDDSGLTWARLYYGDILDLIQFNGAFYVLEQDKGVLRSPDGKDWSQLVAKVEHRKSNKFLEYNNELFSADTYGVFKSKTGLDWTQLTKSESVGEINDIIGYGGVLFIATSEVFNITSPVRGSIGAESAGIGQTLLNSMADKWKSIMGTDVPSPFAQAQPNLDYCKVEDFHLPQKVDWPEKYIFGYGDPKYLTYYQSFPSGEDSSWRGFSSWTKNILWITIFSMPLGQGVRAAKGFFTGVAKESVKDVGEQVAVRSIEKTAGETVEKKLWIGRSVKEGGSYTIPISVPLSQSGSTVLLGIEKEAAQDVRRGAFAKFLEEQAAGKKVVETAETQAKKFFPTGALKDAARVAGFITPIAYLAALMDSMFTKYESFGNSLVFKYHSKEPFRKPEPLPLNIKPYKTTLFVEGKEIGNYKETLRPIILDKEHGTPGSFVSYYANPWAKGLLGDQSEPSLLTPFYLAAPCEGDLQVGDTTVYCKQYIYNPETHTAECKMVRENLIKAVDYCGTLMNNGKVAQGYSSNSVIAKDCALPAIRVTVKNQENYDIGGKGSKYNFCFKRESWKAELAMAGTIAATSLVAMYTGGFWLTWGVGVVGGLIEEYIEPDWPEGVGYRGSGGSQPTKSDDPLHGFDLGFG